LANQKPYTPYVSRKFGEILFQMPALIAIKTGIRNLPLLSFLFSLPLFLHSLLGLTLCAWAAGRKNLRYLLFPLISLFAGSMNGSFMIIHVGLLMISLYWVLLFFTIFCDRFNFWKSATFSVLALVSLRTYESMSYLGVILGTLAIWRAWRAETNLANRLVWIFFAIWFFTGARIAIHAILTPFVLSNNFELFKEGFFSMFNLRIFKMHSMLMSSFATILFLLTLPLLTGKLGKVIFLFLLGAYGVFTVFSGFVPVFFLRWFTPVSHYAMRSFYCFLPVGLTLILLRLRSGPQLQKNHRVWARSFIIVTILAFGQITWHIFATTQWRKYLTAFCDALETHQGIISCEQSHLTYDALMKRGIANMGWDWTYPTLSILLAPRGEIRTMIELKSSDVTSFRPFNLQDSTKWPNLSAYGLVYKINGR